MPDLPPDLSSPADLVRMASDLLDAEATEPVFISIDGRTVAPTLVRRAARALLDARLAAAAGDPAQVAAAGSAGEAATGPVRVELAEVTEHVLAWGSVVLSEALAAELIMALAAEGWVEVVRREARALWLRPGATPTAAGPDA